MASDMEEVVPGGASGMNTMAVCVATLRDLQTTELWPAINRDDLPRRVCDNSSDNRGVIGSYQWLYQQDGDADILAYIHDDVTLYNPDWDHRVLREFDDPRVGVVGLGGGLRHGTADIYKTPYRLNQLARDGYLSNVDDAEIHGTRFLGSTEVAVLDGFALVVRKALLDKCGGWPVDHLKFHCYDYWVCCAAHRHGYTVRVVGEKCQHHGGRTSVGSAYHDWCEKHGTTDLQIHQDSHKYIYNEFRDVLPYWVE